MIKTLSKLEIEKNFLNFIKVYQKKSTVNGILRGEKLDFSSQDQEQGKDVLSHFSFSKDKRK